MTAQRPGVELASAERNSAGSVVTRVCGLVPGFAADSDQPDAAAHRPLPYPVAGEVLLEVGKRAGKQGVLQLGSWQHAIPRHQRYLRYLRSPWVPCLPGDTYAGHVTIDHLTGEPAYLQLARILREMITSGKIAPRQPMPSIKSITQQYGVAKGTAEKALGVLRDEGRVVTVPGRGIYVIDR